MKKDFVKILLIFVICIILAFGACMLCACLFDRVQPLASAETVTLPADGVVGDNLANNSHFDKGTSGFIFTNGMSAIVNSDNFLVVTGSATNQRFICDLSSYLIVSHTYTLSFYLLPNSNVFSYLWSEDSLSIINRLDISQSSFYSIVSFTFTVPSSGTNISWRFNGAVDFSIVIQWWKLEVGSSFTGYVPNSYSNYGYDQGYSDGVVRGEDNVQRYNDGVVVAGDLVVPNKTNYPNVTLTHGQVGAGGFRYSGTGDATTTAFGLEVYSTTTSSTLEPVAINYSGNLSSIFNIAILIRSGQSASFTVSVTYGSNNYSHIFTSINEDYLFLIQLYIPFNVIPTSRLIVTFPSNSLATLLKYETVRSDYFTGFSSGGDFKDGYFTGYAAGLAESTTTAFDQGYNEGYDEGYDTAGTLIGDYRYSEGYTNGYNDGIMTADEGTWSNMLSSLINLPVTFILSLIHFEILGFDFANVFRVIVLLSLLSFIIIKVLKGKL